MAQDLVERAAEPR